MKILAICNSFSEDGTAYIERIAESAGITDIIAANLYIPGCPLSRHAENLKTNAPDYDYQRHGKGLYKSNIRDAVLSDQWDIITIQQVSGLSGQPESFQPYFDEVYKEVRALCPDAKIYLHRTWAYEEGSGHGDFPRYDRDHQKMNAAIEDTYQRFAHMYDLPIIPVGNLVTALKKTKEFDIANGGISLYRDRFHMSFVYGRYLAALVWLKVLCGFKAADSKFAPEDSTPEMIAFVNGFVDGYFEK